MTVTGWGFEASVSGVPKNALGRLSISTQHRDSRARFNLDGGASLLMHYLRGSTAPRWGLVDHFDLDAFVSEHPNHAIGAR